MNPFEFLDEFFIAKTFSPWAIRQWRFRDPNLCPFDSVPACDGQTDGWTDEQLNVVKTGLCIASYGDAI